MYASFLVGDVEQAIHHPDGARRYRYIVVNITFIIMPCIDGCRGGDSHLLNIEMGGIVMSIYPPHPHTYPPIIPHSFHYSPVAYLPPPTYEFMAVSRNRISAVSVEEVGYS